MAFELIPLPYDQQALALAISAETLSYHHGKHHKAYIDKTNAAIAGTDKESRSLEQVISETRGSDKGLFNNAAQSWNHGFYWHSLSPERQQPGAELAGRIDAAFGSYGDFARKLEEVGTAHFASGWAWLLDRGGTLAIEDSHDAETFADQGANPLLVLDLWEHAYYLDHQNARPAYLKAVIDGHLNWAFADENLARGTAWKYPG